MIYDRNECIQELKTRGIGACLLHIQTREAGFVNIQELIALEEGASSIRVMAFSDTIEPFHVITEYAIEGETIKKYSSIEELVDDDWRVD